MSEQERLFRPEPVDGRILSVARFRDTLLVTCEYALYQMTPCEGPIQWTIEKLSGSSQIPRDAIRW